MAEPPRVHEDEGGTERADEEDRAAILARRGRWVTAAVGALGVAAVGGMALAQPCLSESPWTPPPQPPPSGDAGAPPDDSGVAQRDASRARPPRRREPEPMPCLFRAVELDPSETPEEDAPPEEPTR